MQQILDLDYNPIKVNTLATVGQDSCIRFWDLRKIDSGVCLHSFNPTSMSSVGHQDLKISMASSNRNNSTSIGGLGANSIAQQH